MKKNLLRSLTGLLARLRSYVFYDLSARVKADITFKKVEKAKASDNKSKGRQMTHKKASCGLS